MVIFFAFLACVSAIIPLGDHLSFDDQKSDLVIFDNYRLHLGDHLQNTVTETLHNDRVVKYWLFFPKEKMVLSYDRLIEDTVTLSLINPKRDFHITGILTPINFSRNGDTLIWSKEDKEVKVQLVDYNLNDVYIFLFVISHLVISFFIITIFGQRACCGILFALAVNPLLLTAFSILSENYITA